MDFHKKGSSSIPLIESHESNERNQIRVTNYNRVKLIIYKRKQRDNSNTKVIQKLNDNATYAETYYKLTTNILLSWYRNFNEEMVG